MRLVATPWVALFLQPVAEHSGISGLAVGRPVADAVLVGAALGVFALMAWRPGAMWLTLGLALMVMGVADAIPRPGAESDTGAARAAPPASVGASELPQPPDPAPRHP